MNPSHPLTKPPRYTPHRRPQWYNPDGESVLEPAAMATLQSLSSLADVDRQTIEEIAAALTAGWPVELIVLYGSKAWGDDTPESDIDLLVLTGRPRPEMICRHE